MLLWHELYIVLYLKKQNWVPRALMRPRKNVCGKEGVINMLCNNFQCCFEQINYCFFCHSCLWELDLCVRVDTYYLNNLSGCVALLKDTSVCINSLHTDARMSCSLSFYHVLLCICFYYFVCIHFSSCIKQNAVFIHCKFLFSNF